MKQVSYGPLIMSIMLMSCYTGFFNVRRRWKSLNTGPRFYLRLIRRTGWLWIFTSRTTDGRPFKSKKLSVPFLYSGVPAGLTEHLRVVSKSGNSGPGPVPNSYFLYYIFIKALILIKFGHNAYNYVFYHIFLNKYKQK